LLVKICFEDSLSLKKSTIRFVWSSNFFHMLCILF